MADLKEIITERGRIKTRITLFEKYLKPLSEIKLSKSQYNELTLRLSKLQDLSYKFDEIQSRVEVLDLADDQMNVHVGRKLKIDCMVSLPKLRKCYKHLMRK